MGKSTMSVAWLALASIGIGGAAYLFRFEPTTVEGNSVVWDRWHQRACYAVPFADIICSQEDVARMSQSSANVPTPEELLGPRPQQ